MVERWMRSPVNFFESIIIAWESIIANKMRSLLTMLGIIIGVSSVITVSHWVKAVELQSTKRWMPLALIDSVSIISMILIIP